MRYLLAFLYRKRIFLLFLALQLVAFSLIFRSRSFQRSSLLNSSSAVTGEVLEVYNEYTQYLDLEHQNERLSEENARLRSLLPDAYLPLTRNTLQAQDTSYDVQYSYVKADVINSSFRKSRNFITLNRGALHGVKREMGVIGPRGAIGIVQNVSDHFCTVIPLINPGISVSGKFKDKKFFGPVNWKNSDYHFVTLSDIPRYAKVNKGDTIITDARSLTFPPGILIGTVDTISLQDDQNFYSVSVELSTDFSSLEQVYIIQDKMKLERQQLENLNTLETH
ncbi:MAG: rod shape-determining protein MreC [Owenweeksia sp.]